MGTPIVTHATMYVWEKHTQLYQSQIYSIIQSILGMTKAQTLDEFKKYGFNQRLGTHTIYTDRFIVYAANKDVKPTEWATPVIEERLQKLELSLPNYELSFFKRSQDRRYVKINPEKIEGLAIFIELTTRSDVLLVPRTDIEGTTLPALYASDDIAQKVNSVAAVQR